MNSDFSSWVGRSEEICDTLDPARTNALSAALGESRRVSEGDPLPLLHHWLYFWIVQAPESLGTDGHPAKGGFLPPIPLPRRMWAGGRIKFVQPLIVGERATRTSKILKIETKSGKSGNLVFVTVEHILSGAQGLAIVEQQDIVYREPAATGMVARLGSTAATPAATWHHEIMPDTVLLFRYSALTMNGHRIHYDRPYAMDAEAYPALVVHGPLQATLLAGLAARNLSAPLTGFDFRGVSPAFDGQTVHVCGDQTADGATLWTEQAGVKAMTAVAYC